MYSMNRRQRQGTILEVLRRSVLHKNLVFVMQLCDCVAKYCVKHMIHARVVMQMFELVSGSYYTGDVK